MTASDINILIGSVVALLLAMGGGAKWLLMYMDAAQAKSDLAESKARDKLSERLHEEIRVLRLELSHANAEKRLYLRRIFQLEGFVMQHGIQIPEMEGWPPE